MKDLDDAELNVWVDRLVKLLTQHTAPIIPVKDFGDRNAERATAELARRGYDFVVLSIDNADLDRLSVLLAGAGVDQVDVAVNPDPST